MTCPKSHSRSKAELGFLPSCFSASWTPKATHRVSENNPPPLPTLAPATQRPSPEAAIVTGPLCSLQNRVCTHKGLCIFLPYLLSSSTCVCVCVCVCVHARRGGAERGRERIPSSLHAVRAEPDAGLDPTNREIMT